MKNVNFYAAVLCGFSFCLSACNVVTSDHQTANEKFRQEQSQNKASVQKQMAMYSGGQPGKISVNGTVVQNNQIDSRIHIVQKFGDSQRLSPKIAVLVEKNDDDSAGLRSLSKSVSSEMTEKLSSDRSYIQIGCGDINASWIAELKEIKNQGDSELISANTVVLCGAKTFSSSKVEIRAHALYLKTASLEMQNAAGSLTIAANKVYLSGSSKIETVGIDATSNVLPAASIELNIVQGLFDNGNLKLSSIGGNCKMP